jgi:hypothetical protein
MADHIGFYWEGAYDVRQAEGEFTASRKGYPEHVVTADSAEALRVKIRCDYFAWMATLRERMSS